MKIPWQFKSEVPRLKINRICILMRNYVWHVTHFGERYRNLRLFYIYFYGRHCVFSHCLKYFGCANMLTIALKQDCYSEICFKNR